MKDAHALADLSVAAAFGFVPTMRSSWPAAMLVIAIVLSANEHVIGQILTIALKGAGLMAMAAYGSTPESARKDFIALRELRDHLQQQLPPDVSLHELSMGMSGDFEVAVEEGATIVRIGSLVFEGLDR